MRSYSLNCSLLYDRGEAINLLLKDSVRLAMQRTLTEEEMNSFHSRKFYPRDKVGDGRIGVDCEPS